MLLLLSFGMLGLVSPDLLDVILVSDMPTEKDKLI
jgi:hypothetical protein